MRWLNDRYRLDAPVGRGGMAVVWRGYDAVLRRVVAVKMLPDLADDDRSHERLRAEALAAAQLSHACVASVYDYGEAPAGWRRKAPFLVMEYVDGQTLAARLASGPLPWREAVRVCAGIADALAVAHASGLVHRDIKPSNVILSGSAVKVVDFGIATSTGGSQSEGGGVVFGTQAYMAPEQAAETPALPASDIYALGLVLRDCLTGKRTRPATGQQTVPAAGQPTEATPPGSAESVPALPPDVPAPVAALIAACLSDTPRARPTGVEAAAVLHQATGGPQPAPLRTPTPTAGSPTVPAARTEPAAPGGRRWPGALPRSHRGRRHRVSAAQAALVAAAAAVLTVPLVLLPALQPGDSTSGDAGTSAAPAPHGPPRGPAGDCVAEFSARYLPNGTFTGVLNLTWTGARSLVPWSVEFALPAGHRLVGADPGRLAKDHGTVSITSDQRLAPGQTVTVALRGTADDHAGAPHDFALDGHTCTGWTSDVQTTETVPGPTRTVRVPPATGTPDEAPTTNPPTTSVAPSTMPPSTPPSTSQPAPSTSSTVPQPSASEPSSPESSAVPSSSDPSATGDPAAPGNASPAQSSI